MPKPHSLCVMELRVVRRKGSAVATGASEKTNSDFVVVIQGYIHETNAPVENNAGRSKSCQLRTLPETEQHGRKQWLWYQYPPPLVFWCETKQVVDQAWLEEWAVPPLWVMTAYPETPLNHCFPPGSTN